MVENVTSRARAIRLVTLDVDGVLTDGRIYVDDDGREFKAYSALDGQGIKMLQSAGVIVAWITGSDAPSVRHRARHLGVEHLVTGASHKVAAWEALRASLDMPAQCCAHVGDDLPDVPLLAACGLAVTMPHAPDAVRKHAHYVTRREGGAGAVREVAELVLRAQDRLEAAEAIHTAPRGGP
ncbi:MAG TPA: HAD family hydrolase [Casimicrobiaceae bacterium]|nr:HAD family hydrolase [Casimicrobiaceae bacterium]